MWMKRFSISCLLLSWLPAAGVSQPDPDPSPVLAPRYDLWTTPTLDLLDVPEDPIAYHEARLEIAGLYEAGRYAEARPVAERLVDDYPRDGENWLWLGYVHRRLGNHREAAAAFATAGPLLGWGPPNIIGIHLASQLLDAGDERAALDQLRWDLHRNRSVFRNRLFEWSYFESLRDDPTFRELAGRPDTSGWSRNEGWRRDIAYLRDEIRRVNPVYHDAPLPTEFSRRYEELVAAVPRLSEAKIFMGMSHMLAALRQGHTVLLRPPGSRYLPLRFYAFPDGVFVIEAPEEHRDMIGSRLLEVGDVPLADLLERLRERRSVDGPMYHLWRVSDLASTHHLEGVAAIDDAEAVPMTLEMPEGLVREVRIPTRATAPEERQDRLAVPPGIEPPLFLSRMEQSHWETPLPEVSAHYVQVNNLVNETEESMAAFGQRLRTILSPDPPSSLILDLRHNNGGTTQLYTELLRTLVDYSVGPRTQVYVLIGRRTYSAAANLITDLERLVNPLFVGEASSECCHFYGDPALLQLPYSGVLGEVTAVEWNLSLHVFDGRSEMSPEVPVQLTAEAYFAGRDPALEAVFQLIQRRRVEMEPAR